MKTNELKVIIRGRPKSGKSTLGVFVMQALVKAGVKMVTLVDDSTKWALIQKKSRHGVLMDKSITIESAPPRMHRRRLSVLRD